MSAEATGTGRGRWRGLARVVTAMVALMSGASTVHAERITVAAAADLQFAMDALVATFRRQFPGDDVRVVYGSSGKFLTQIQQGAPFDLYFSADEAYPRQLIDEGLAVPPAKTYARGRLVLWSMSLPAAALTWSTLTQDKVRRVAIANPEHAPYGRRAEEALRHAGVWAQVQPRLVMGENIAQAAQFVLTGNAEVGLVALSLVSVPERKALGAHVLVPESFHQPLDQAFVITRQGAGKPLARRFADHVVSPMSRSIMASYGFLLPGSGEGR